MILLGLLAWRLDILTQKGQTPNLEHLRAAFGKDDLDTKGLSQLFWL